jgi:lysophospholipase L1-like esterase
MVEDPHVADLAFTATTGAVPVPRPGPRIERRVILLLATVLVANPAILFLLTRSLLVACLIPAACIVAIQIVASRPTWTIFTAYLFNAMALVSVFAHAEVIFVYGFPNYVVENLYTIEDGYYFNRPLLDQTFSSKEYVVRYRTNVQGFRIGQEQDPNQTYTNADWLVIGDSFTQGAQVDFSELYTTQLYERFPDKIVINAGISGLGLGHEYNYFTKSGYRYSPDIVILQLSGFNDFMNVEPTAVGFTDRLITYSAFLRFLLADFKFTNPAELPLGRWTEPFQPDPQANADFNVFYNESSPTKARDLEAFERYLTMLRDAVRGRGARLVVALIPTKEQVHPRYLEEVLGAFKIEPSQIDVERPNRLLAALTQRLQVDLVDLLPAFQAAGGNPFFDYDEHLTPLGHRVLAEALAERLEQMVGPSPVRLLSDGSGADRYPVMSRDGSLITYQSFRDGNMELFAAAADLSLRQRLTFNDVDESHPMLSQDNSQILFTEGPAESQRTEVVVMNLDGSNRTTLTAEPNVFGAIPTFSRSNLQIAYAEWSYDESASRFSLPRIVVLDVVTGDKRYLTPPERDSWRPVFSPDGGRVFYISKTEDQFDLYAYDLATGIERQLTWTPFDEWDPQVSPDGSHLVYAARADDNWDLFVLDLGTSRTSRVTRTKGDEWDPSVTPDGASILFAGRFGLMEAMFAVPFPN